MTKFYCKYCRKIIIEDLEKFLEEDKENYIECPYCKGLMKRVGNKIEKR